MAQLKQEFERTKEPRDEAKYLALRGEIIEHNLKMCLDYAYRHCRKIGNRDNIEDIFGECVVALEMAVDNFDVSRGLVFTTICYKYMETHLYNLYIKHHDDALNVTREISLVNEEDDDGGDIFYFLADEGESHIAEDVASDDTVRLILGFINSIQNKRDKEIFKMSLGIGCGREYTQRELGNMFNLAQSVVSRIIKKYKEELVEFLRVRGIDNVSSKVEVKKLTFTSIEERNNYIFNSYYGINGCAKKDVRVLAGECGVVENHISYIIAKMRKAIKAGQTQRGLSDLKVLEVKRERTKKYSDELIKAVCEDYFGLNGKNILPMDEILTKHNISYNARHIIVCRYLRENHTEKECQEFYARREDFERKKKLKECVYIYFSFKGLNGYEKKTQLALARELGVSRCVIYDAIKKFEEYLNGLSEEERASILNGDESFFE